MADLNAYLNKRGITAEQMRDARQKTQADTRLHDYQAFLANSGELSRDCVHLPLSFVNRIEHEAQGTAEKHPLLQETDRGRSTVMANEDFLAAKAEAKKFVLTEPELNTVSGGMKAIVAKPGRSVARDSSPAVFDIESMDALAIMGVSDQKGSAAVALVDKLQSDLASRADA